MSSEFLGNESEPATSQTERSGSLEGGLRVLLVEDHADTRMSMEILLKRAGHQVRSAGTAHEAISLAANEKFDVVITDIGLPDRSGTDLMRELHERHGLIGIATSGYGASADATLDLDDGFAYHLIKPISMPRLRELLREIFAHAQKTQIPPL